jgi:hypothetical protein
MRHRAAQHGRMGLTQYGYVVEIAATALQKPEIFFAADGLTDLAHIFILSSEFLASPGMPATTIIHPF